MSDSSADVDEIRGRLVIQCIKLDASVDEIHRRSRTQSNVVGRTRGHFWHGVVQIFSAILAPVRPPGAMQRSYITKRRHRKGCTAAWTSTLVCRALGA